LARINNQVKTRKERSKAAREADILTAFVPMVEDIELPGVEPPLMS